MAAVMVAAFVVAPAESGTSAPDSTPQRLAIYYGIPSLVNGAAGSVARAAAVFADYDLVVFGDGLEFPDVVAGRVPAGAGPQEHQRTRDIIASLAESPRRTRVYGYVDLGHTQKLPPDEIARRVRLWKAMNVHGIFFDEAGYDYGVTRARQNAAVEAAHRLGLRVALNAFRPEDVFAGPDPHRLQKGDAYVLESFAVRLGQRDLSDFGRERITSALALARRAGVDVWAVTTTDAKVPFDPAGMAHAWRAANEAGVDAFGWGEADFSGPSSRLPWRERPALAPTRGRGNRGGAN